MAILISPETPDSKERAKWEMFPSAYGTPGRPYVYREFPKMFYKAVQPESGPAVPSDHRVAETEAEEAQMRHLGYFPTQQEALDALRRDQMELSRLAANRSYNDRNMSDSAKAEVESAEELFDGHMAEVPRTAVTPRKPGRPRKTEVS